MRNPINEVVKPIVKRQDITISNEELSYAVHAIESGTRARLRDSITDETVIEISKRGEYMVLYLMIS